MGYESTERDSSNSVVLELGIIRLCCTQRRGAAEFAFFTSDLHSDLVVVSMFQDAHVLKGGHVPFSKIRKLHGVLMDNDKFKNMKSIYKHDICLSFYLFRARAKLIVRQKRVHATRSSRTPPPPSRKK